MPEPLITKYRPTRADEFLGNTEVVNSLMAAVVTQSHPHSFLFTGPSGIGKTTLARIVASVYRADMYEIDAASNSGVEDSRNLVELGKVQPLGSSSRMFIIDECHALSKQAWQPWLKVLEEPPKWLFISLCTTELSKVPDAVRTRCYHVPLKPVHITDIQDLLTAVISIEGFNVTDDVFSGIAQAAAGSPRRALRILQAGHAAKTREELSKVVQEADSESDPAVEICKMLIQRVRDWPRYRELLEKIDGNDEVIIPSIRYIQSVMLKSEAEKAMCCAAIIAALSDQRYREPKTQLTMAVAELLWSGQ